MATMGVGLFLDAWFADDLSVRRWWIIAACLVLAVVGLGAYLRLRELRRRLDDLTGSAYFLLADAVKWRADPSIAAFLKDVDAVFSRSYTLMSAKELNSDWAWPYDGEGLASWSGGVDDSVAAFRAVHHIDAPHTPNTVFCWMPWPASMAWSARLLSTGPINLRVGHRDSLSRQGFFTAQPDETYLTFRRGEDPAPSRVLVGTSLPPRRVNLKVVPPQSGLPDQGRGKGQPLPDSAGAPTIRILLVRQTTTEWCGLTHDAPHSQPFDLTVEAPPAVGLSGDYSAEFLEWQLKPAEPTEGHAWVDFPGLARAALDWIAASTLDEGVTLVATQVPPEVALGMGIDIATSDRVWPERLLPICVLRRGTRPCIPLLDLGSKSLRGEVTHPRCSN
jgi:hypothetical protein